MDKKSRTPITVRCACGWQVSGPEDEVLTATTEHGHRLHNMVPSREEVLAMRVDPHVSTPGLQ